MKEPNDLRSISHYAEWGAARRILHPEFPASVTPKRLRTTRGDTRPYTNVERTILERLREWGQRSIAGTDLDTRYPYLLQWRVDRFLRDTFLADRPAFFTALYTLLKTGEPDIQLASPSLKLLVRRAIFHFQHSIDADIQLDRLLD